MEEYFKLGWQGFHLCISVHVVLLTSVVDAFMCGNRHGKGMIQGVQKGNSLFRGEMLYRLTAVDIFWRLCAFTGVFCNHIPAEGNRINGADCVMDVPDCFGGVAADAAVFTFGAKLIVKCIQITRLNSGQLQVSNGRQDMKPQESFV